MVPDALFPTLIIMGWDNPNHNKPLILSPESFKYNVALMRTGANRFVFFDPFKAISKGKNHDYPDWEDKFYTADELMDLVNENYKNGI